MAHELRPKPKRAPERESTNEWYAPADMRAMGTPASECTACGISNVCPAPDAAAAHGQSEKVVDVVGEEGSAPVPMPSCPNAFEPHAKSLESALLTNMLKIKSRFGC